MVVEVDEIMSENDPEEADNIAGHVRNFSLNRSKYNDLVISIIFLETPHFSTIEATLKLIAKNSNFRDTLSPIQAHAIYEVLANPDTPEKQDFFLLAVKNCFQGNYFRFGPDFPASFKMFWISLIYTTIHEMNSLSPQHLPKIFGDKLSMEELETATSNYFIKSSDNYYIIFTSGHTKSLELWLKMHFIEKSIDKAIKEITYEYNDRCNNAKMLRTILDTVGPRSLTQEQKLTILLASTKRDYKSVVNHLINEVGVELNEKAKYRLLRSAIGNSVIRLVLKAFDYQFIPKDELESIAFTCYEKIYVESNQNYPKNIAYFPQIIIDRVKEIVAAKEGSREYLRILVGESESSFDYYSSSHIENIEYFDSHRARRLLATWKLEQESIDNVFLEALKMRRLSVLEFMVNEPSLSISQSVKNTVGSTIFGRIEYYSPLLAFLSKNQEIFPFESAELEHALTLCLVPKQIKTLKKLLKHFKIHQEALDQALLAASKAGHSKIVESIVTIKKDSFTTESLKIALTFTKDTKTRSQIIIALNKRNDESAGLQ